MRPLIDDIDRANDMQETLHSKRIEQARKRAAKINTSNPTGVYLSSGCEGITGTARRFCNKGCAELWEKYIEN